MCGWLRWNGSAREDEKSVFSPTARTGNTVEPNESSAIYRRTQAHGGGFPKRARAASATATATGGVGNRCEPRTSTAAAASQPSPVNVREEQEEKRCKTLKKSKDSERKILERHWYSQIMNENDLLLINTQLHNLTILNSDIFMI